MPGKHGYGKGKTPRQAIPGQPAKRKRKKKRRRMQTGITAVRG